MRLDSLSGLVALVLSIPALMQVAAGRLDVAGAAGRITVVLLACAAAGTLLQSVVSGYARSAEDAALPEDADAA